MRHLFLEDPLYVTELGLDGYPGASIGVLPWLNDVYVFLLSNFLLFGL
jgi:hypothetical protein